ncbi:MAG TPA: hypothetical protein PLX41_05930 [Bacteroidales bacterium]|nr:hypothetical protein [Bacteroidales bacterium]HPR73187.1 hypothetical protein [Bacteroidales bacterium]
MKNLNTIHTSRTIMFAELDKVMSYAIDTGDFEEAFEHNVTGKKSNSGVEKTKKYLKSLYKFDKNYHPFEAFFHFWKISEPRERQMMAFIYAINHDDLLAESIDVLKKTMVGEKAAIELFESNIESCHPNQYSPNTKKSLAQNIASSWKQAGFIEGKVKNIRVTPEINFRIACLAFLLGYLKGDRSDFIWSSTGVKALCLPETRLRELAIECSRNDLMQYQYAGGVTAIEFKQLINKIGIDGNKD